MTRLPGSLDHSPIGDRPVERVLSGRIIFMAFINFSKGFSYSLNGVNPRGVVSVKLERQR